MSREHVPAGPVIEWSPQGTVVWEGGRSTAYGPGAVLPLAGRAAIVAVSRRSVFIRALRVPNAAPEEIRLVISARLAELFPVGEADLAYDFHLTSDVGPEGRLVIVAAMPAGELRATHDQLRASGIRVRQTLPVAFGAALLAAANGRADAVVVERSELGASVDVVSGGHLVYSRAGGTAPLDVEVARTLAAAGLPCLPVIAAGGADVPEAEAHTLTSTLEALGGGAERFRLNIELPETIARREAERIGKRKRLAGLLSVAALALAVTAYLDFADAAASVNEQKAQYDAKLRKLKSIQTQAETDAAKAVTLQQALARAFSPAQRMNDALTVAVNLAPADVWLTGLTAERGKPMQIRGTAKTNDAVAAFVRALGAEPRFRDVRLVFANNALIDTTPVFQFSVTAFPVGNLPILQQSRPGGTRT